MEKNQLRQEHQEQMTNMQLQFQEVKDRLDTNISDLQDQVGELQHMYDNRPSRPEDIDQIRSLERDCRDREAAFTQLKDEMQV